MAISILLSISLIHTKPQLKVTSMKRRLLYTAVMLGLEQLEQQLIPAQPHHNSAHPLDDPLIVQALLNDRYGPFDVVAGQRHPLENIP